MGVEKDYDKLLDELDDRLAEGKVSEENYERLRDKYLSKLEKTDKKVAVKREMKRAIEEVEEDFETSKKLHVAHRVERPVETPRPKKKMGLGFKLFILLIIGLSYLYLDLMAAQQMAVMPSGLNFPSIGLTQTTVSGKLMLYNPTPIPIILGNMNYYLTYGSNIITNTETGFVMIMPMSSQEVDFGLTIPYTGIGGTLIDSVKNAFSGQQQSIDFVISAGIGPIQIPIFEQKVLG